MSIETPTRIKAEPSSNIRVIRIFMAKPEAVREVRNMARDVLEPYADSEMLDVAELMASELATNAVQATNDDRSGTPQDEPKKFLAGAGHLKGVTYMFIADSSSGMPAMHEHDPSSLLEGSRGLSLVDELSSTWGVITKVIPQDIKSALPSAQKVVFFTQRNSHPQPKVPAPRKRTA